MTLDEALAALSESRPLPGKGARECMLPEYRRGPYSWPAPAVWKDAAVLILLYPDAGLVRFPLMLRTSGSGVHSGQISLPGGARENGERMEACALRETQEEFGIDPSSIRVIRGLTPLGVTPSSFLVRPYVGVTDGRPAFRPSPAEVQALLETSLDELLDSGNRLETHMELGGRSWRVPYYHLAGKTIWGATALILAELEAMLRAQGA